jgi:hypothetical protein
MTNNYRLYYNSDGSPKYYSMQDLPGDYIVVDQQTFECSRYDVVVINGKLKSLSDNIIAKYYLSTDSDTSIECDPDDISIVVDSDRPHISWDWRTSI